jgi:hypothetical protein
LAGRLLRACADRFITDRKLQANRQGSAYAGGTYSTLL